MFRLKFEKFTPEIQELATLNNENWTDLTQVAERGTSVSLIMRSV